MRWQYVMQPGRTVALSKLVLGSPACANAGERVCGRTDNIHELLDSHQETEKQVHHFRRHQGMKSVSILIADDHAVVRHGLRALLETQTGWKVVAAARTGREALEK